MRYLLILLTLSGCAPAYMEPEITPYANSFGQYMSVDLHDVSIKFGDLRSSSKERVLGVCRTADGHSGDITIDRSAWLEMDEISREQLIWHELGHCALARGHADMLVLTDCGLMPGSIMYPYFFGGDECYRNKIMMYKEALKNNTIIR
jgi:hypothetical protein